MRVLGHQQISRFVRSPAECKAMPWESTLQPSLRCSHQPVALPSTPPCSAGRLDLLQELHQRGLDLSGRTGCAVLAAAVHSGAAPLVRWLVGPAGCDVAAALKQVGGMALVRGCSGLRDRNKLVGAPACFQLVAVKPTAKLNYKPAGQSTCRRTCCTRRPAGETPMCCQRCCRRPAPPASAAPTAAAWGARRCTQPSFMGRRAQPSC